MPPPVAGDPQPDDAYVAPWQVAVLFFFAAVVGGALAVGALPIWLGDLQASLFGPDPKGYWYLTRTSGMVAYGLAWMSMAFGLLISNKLARLWPGGPTAFALHEYTSLLALAFSVVHAGVLLGDHYIGFTLPQILAPFTGLSYRPLAVALGQLAFYGLGAVSLSFYARRALGPRAWRMIHGLSYAVFALALLHGITSGADSAETWAQVYYWGTGASIVWLTIYRLLARSGVQAAARERPPMVGRTR